jgi:hypothetical protein
MWRDMPMSQREATLGVSRRHEGARSEREGIKGMNSSGRHAPAPTSSGVAAVFLYGLTARRRASGAI